MAVTKEQAELVMWRKAHLWPMLDKNQQGMYWAFRQSENPKFVFDVARRVGKSTTMVTIGVEECLRRPKAMVKFGAATQEMVKEIIIPLIDRITENAPPDLKPKFMPSEMSMVFANKSRMKLVGLDMHPDRLRGTALDLALIDEAAFVDELEYVVQSVLVPQMQGRPWARILLGSTPPKTPAHKWSTRYVPEAKANGSYCFRTIEDNPRIGPKERAFFIQEAGGPEAVENLRENYAQHIVDEELAVLPEFQKAEKDIVKDVTRPEYFESYVSMDPGFTDLTAVLFAYYDFDTDTIVVEDEIGVNKTNTNHLAVMIQKKESELWGKSRRKDGRPHPTLRISDVDLRLIADMQIQHRLTFVPTKKDDKDAAINGVRTAIQKHKVIINPRCKMLISHCKFGIWNRHRTSFERSGDYGHFDGIDALVYLVRNVTKGKNPYPTYMHGERPDTHFMQILTERSSQGSQIKKIFSRRARHG